MRLPGVTKNSLTGARPFLLQQHAMSDHTRYLHTALANVLDTDHTVWINIGTIIGIPFIFTFDVITHAVRRTVDFGFDDGSAVAATVCSSSCGLSMAIKG